jgi:hypothetical protein
MASYAADDIAKDIAEAEESPVKAASDTEALARAAQNPIASMISLPFQSNFNFGVGKDDDMGYILNVQPVYPIKLSDDWNVVTRTIMPIIYQPAMTAASDDEFGLGDISPAFYFSPVKTFHSIIWGAGPIMTFPTATDKVLGTGKCSIGPTFIALTMKGPWVAGGIINNQWSFAGDDDRKDVNLMLMQPFVNYNLPKGWYLTTSPIITANWEAQNSQMWTIPIGGGFGKILKIGGQPINAQLAGYYNIERPTGSGDWQIRFQVQFLFPKK